MEEQLPPGLAKELPPLRGLHPDAAVTLPDLPRRQASLETNLCRKGVWQTGPLQLTLPLDGADTLGLLRTAGPPLSLLDLDVFAWLVERWREDNRDPHGGVYFTFYELGWDLYEYRVATARICTFGVRRGSRARKAAATGASARGCVLDATHFGSSSAAWCVLDAVDPAKRRV